MKYSLLILVINTLHKYWANYLQVQDVIPVLDASHKCMFACWIVAFDGKGNNLIIKLGDNSLPQYHVNLTCIA